MTRQDNTIPEGSPAAELVPGEKEGMIVILKAMANKPRFTILQRLASGEQPFSVLMQATGLQKTALASHLVQLLDAGLILRPANSRGMYAISTDGLSFIEATQVTYKRSMACARLAAVEKARSGLSEAFLADFFVGRA